jgi:hypothetical protein
MRRISAERAALAFAQRLAEISAQLLGERLLSLILRGSLTFHDYVPRQSDIDLLAIGDHALSDSEIDSLTRAVTAERAQAPAPVDLRFITRAVATTPPEPPPLELYIRLKPSAPPAVEARRREPDRSSSSTLTLGHSPANRRARNRRSGSVAASRRACSNASRASSWRPRRRSSSARVECRYR